MEKGIPKGKFCFRELKKKDDAEPCEYFDWDLDGGKCLKLGIITDEQKEFLGKQIKICGINL